MRLSAIKFAQTYFKVMRRLNLHRRKPQNPKYIPKPYQAALFPGEKVQVNVRVIPTSCIVGKSKRTPSKTLFEEQLQAYGIECSLYPET